MYLRDDKFISDKNGRIAKFSYHDCRRGDIYEADDEEYYMADTGEFIRVPTQYATATTHSTQSSVYYPNIENSWQSIEDMVITAVKHINPPEVIVKCVACGQWGAIKTPCRHCGNPIDPLE